MRKWKTWSIPVCIFTAVCAVGFGWTRDPLTMNGFFIRNVELQILARADRALEALLAEAGDDG